MSRKVLVVDDEKLIVKGIRFSLEQDGMEVDCAYDGEEALKMATENHYDMILLDIMLPKMDGFNLRLRMGVFWYYFEDNPNPAPRVMQEDMGPCQYINPLLNREYLFRVLYYERRISLEVFHALTDGNGALMFLKELVYQYLRLVHPEIGKGDRMELHE